MQKHVYLCVGLYPDPFSMCTMPLSVIIAHRGSLKYFFHSVADWRYKHWNPVSLKTGSIVTFQINTNTDSHVSFPYWQLRAITHVFSNMLNQKINKHYQVNTRSTSGLAWDQILQRQGVWGSNPSPVSHQHQRHILKECQVIVIYW